jgi:iron-sulfur cluster assembly protein
MTKYEIVIEIPHNPESSKIKDKIIKIADLEICIDSKSAIFIDGTELDYSDGLNGAGFVFKNPKANYIKITLNKGNLTSNSNYTI